MGKLRGVRSIFIGALGLTFGLALASKGFQTNPQSTNSPPAPSTTPAQTTTAQPQASSPPVYSAPSPYNTELNMVVVDPAHGGTDLGARGTEGIRESEEVLVFTGQLSRTLEAHGFQVVMTREGNDNPSFDDRSARANAQRGAVFITLHIASTGLAGTVRVYVMPELPIAYDPTGLIPWDRAQTPFLGLSRKLGDLVQAELAKRFKGSPNTAQVAPVRQLRTTAAPAIAVEVSSVAVPERGELDRMVPGVADAITRGVMAFRPSYVIPTFPGTGGRIRP